MPFEELKVHDGYHTIGEHVGWLNGERRGSTSLHHTHFALHGEKKTRKSSGVSAVTVGPTKLFRTRQRKIKMYDVRTRVNSYLWNDSPFRGRY